MATDMLATFQKHIEDMRNLSLCKICIKPFYEPFILPCGHTYCYSCLASWFGGAEGRRSKKSCPDCRAKVRAQPSPNYLLRDLVHMFIGRAELLPEDETVQEHQTAKEQEAGLLAADRSGPGLFKGAFLTLGPGLLQRDWRRGILDPGDNVMRCPDCHWELEEGECGRCGFHEFDVSGSDSDGDDGLDGSIDLDDSEMDDDDDLDHEFGHTMGEHPLNYHYNDASRIPSFSSDDDSGDDEEDNDMDGFIDNEAIGGESDSDGDTESTMTIYNRQFQDHHHQHDDQASVSSERSYHPDPRDPPLYVDLGTDLQDFSSDAPSRTNDEHSETATNHDEMTEESEPEVTPVRAAPPRRRGGLMRVILSSDDEEEDEDNHNVDTSVGTEHNDEEEDSDAEHDAVDNNNASNNDRHYLDLLSDASATEPSNSDEDSEDSEDSDDSIRPPQYSNQRRQQTAPVRARRSNYNSYQGGRRRPSPPTRQSSSRQQSHRGRGTTNRYQPYQRPYGSAGRRIPVGGGNRGYPV
ncbi:E3 ubiquitin ligase [Cladophialophora chaetospira]|uniref:E3 ubiquitin ligase n=1 Tax=Cladophialophora chaetospira TaxID=386627 RepID=A0AA38X444_9EURO|nr:E3 ubiquitin ligase [Cladophialophora chaetospira]